MEGLAPAGAVWPLQAARDGPLALDYPDGAAVAVMFEAAARGADLREFNAARFIREVRERLPEDPWLLDRAPLVEALVTRSMRVTLIRPVPREDVLVDVPDGTWMPASTFATVVKGGEQLLACERGVTPYYGADGRRMVVVYDEAGATAVTSRPD
jgi:hypothetical protein